MNNDNSTGNLNLTGEDLSLRSELTETDALRNAVKRLLKSMDCIRAWADAAKEHLPPFGNNYRSALDCIQIEAEAAISANTKETEK